MKSLRELLLLGPGPSSSHTIAPYRIAKDFLFRHEREGLSDIVVVLRGSLSLTGKGHRTDQVLKNAFQDYSIEVVFDQGTEHLKHPNTLVLKAKTKSGKELEETYYSLGGGAFRRVGDRKKTKDCYPFSTFDGMKDYMRKENIEDPTLVIERFEGEEIWDFSKNLLKHSFATIERGLQDSSLLPGPLKVQPVSAKIFKQAQKFPEEGERLLLLLSSYAYATSEENARGREVVTAPTCGSSGVVPALLYYGMQREKRDIDSLSKAYLVGAMMANFIKENASLSGAVLGCQAEIGSACSFAAASYSSLMGLCLHQIEYASEVAMEHFLGLTCDPVDGYVQVPCIERNAMAAVHAYTSYLFAKDIAPCRSNLVSFDNVVRAMKLTGKELPSSLKETSLGGLAKVIHIC